MGFSQHGVTEQETQAALAEGTESASN